MQTIKMLLLQYT